MYCHWELLSMWQTENSSSSNIVNEICKLIKIPCCESGSDTQGQAALFLSWISASFNFQETTSGAALVHMVPQLQGGDLATSKHQSCMQEQTPDQSLNLLLLLLLVPHNLTKPRRPFRSCDDGVWNKGPGTPCSWRSRNTTTGLKEAQIEAYVCERED